MILNKPSGISVLKDNTKSKTSFSDIVNNYCPNAKPCHRLDRNTSGLIIYAKNQEILEILLEKFKNREIEKYYKAVVYGIPKLKESQMQAYLFKDNKKSIVYISDTFKKGYKKILTTYKILDINKKLNISFIRYKFRNRQNSSNSCTSCSYWSPYTRRWKIWYKLIK